MDTKGHKATFQQWKFGQGTFGQGTFGQGTFGQGTFRQGLHVQLPKNPFAEILFAEKFPLKFAEKLICRKVYLRNFFLQNSYFAENFICGITDLQNFGRKISYLASSIVSQLAVLSMVSRFAVLSNTMNIVKTFDDDLMLKNF
jgi:hypothetical protein